MSRVISIRDRIDKVKINHCRRRPFEMFNLLQNGSAGGGRRKRHTKNTQMKNHLSVLRVLSTPLSLWSVLCLEYFKVLQKVKK